MRSCAAPGVGITDRSASVGSGQRTGGGVHTVHVVVMLWGVVGEVWVAMGVD